MDVPGRVNITRACVSSTVYLQQKLLNAQLGPESLLLRVLLKSPNHTCPIFQIAVPQPSSAPCFPNIIIPFIWLTNPSIAPLQWQMQGCRFYWLCWSPHFISASIPLTCQHPSCCWGTKPSWWIAPLPHRMSTFHFAFLIHLYTPSTDLERKAPNQERSLSRVIALAHESVAVSFVEFVFLLVIWFSSSLFFQPPHLPITYTHPIPHLSCIPSPFFFFFSRFLESEVFWGKGQEWFGEFMWVIYFCSFILLFFFISTITLRVVSNKCFRNVLHLFKFPGFLLYSKCSTDGNN